MKKAISRLQNPESSWFHFLTVYVPKGVVVLVASRDRKVVGVSMVYKGTCGFFIDLKHRRQGIGKFLLRTAAQIFGPGLACRPRDEKSRKFFEQADPKLGLRIVGTPPPPADGKPLRYRSPEVNSPSPANT